MRKRKLSLINKSFLWEKIHEYAKKAGRAGTRPLLLMYYVLKSKDTPSKDKLAVFSSIAYLVLPLDLLSAKRLPIIGLLDEVTSLAVAIDRVAKHITPEIQAQADATLERWFPTDGPEYVDYEMVVS